MNSQTHEQQHAGKTALFVLIKNALLQCVRAQAATESQLSSPIQPILSILFCILPYWKQKKMFLQKRGSLISSLQATYSHKLHSITLNGCLVRIRSRSQPYNYLRQPLSKACTHAWLLALPTLQHLIQFSKFEKWEGYTSLLPLNVRLMCWLAGA